MTKRGIHLSASIYHGYDHKWWANELVEMGMDWAKLLDDGHGSSIGMCKALLAVGITPIVRLYRNRPNPGILSTSQLETVATLVDLGVRYFEPNNEPNLVAEWKDGKIGTPEEVVDNWLYDAHAILDKGGFPAFPALAQCGHTMNDQAFGSIPWYERAFCHLFDRRDVDALGLFRRGAWLAVHDAVLNHFYYDEGRGWHFEYPYDPICQVDQPGKTILQDDNSLIGHRAPLEILSRYMDSNALPVVISTEGGIFVPPAQAAADNRYPTVTYGTHALGTVAMFDWLETNVPELTAMCPWLIANEKMGHDDKSWTEDAWYHKNGPRPVVAAMKASASPSPAPPAPTQSVQSVIRNLAWNALGIPYNPDLAFPRYAKEYGLGQPVTKEFDVSAHDEAGNATTYRAQGFSVCILFAKVGDWQNIMEMEW